MNPAYVAVLREAGVLDGSRADQARVALLDLYERARCYARWVAPREAQFEAEVKYALDPVMSGTSTANGIRYAKKLAADRRRRAR